MRHFHIAWLLLIFLKLILEEPALGAGFTTMPRAGWPADPRGSVVTAVFKDDVYIINYHNTNDIIDVKSGLIRTSSCSERGTVIAADDEREYLNCCGYIDWPENWYDITYVQSCDKRLKKFKPDFPVFRYLESTVPFFFSSVYLYRTSLFIVGGLGYSDVVEVETGTGYADFHPFKDFGWFAWYALVAKNKFFLLGSGLEIYDIQTRRPIKFNYEDFLIGRIFSDRKYLYITGRFNVLKNQPRPGLARFDLDTLILSDWSPNVSGVDGVLTVGDEVILSGNFTSVDGQPRKYLASVSAADGKVTDWNPQLDGVVDRMDYVGGQLILSAGSEHSFKNIGGIPVVSPVSLPRIGWSAMEPPVRDGDNVKGLVYGLNGNRYRVEVSEDLSNWSPISTNTVVDGKFEFIRPGASTSGFYRSSHMP